MKHSIRAILITFVFMLIFTGQIYAIENHNNQEDWGLFIEGANINPDVLPFDTPRGLVLPVRFVVERLGGSIEWYPHTKEVRGELNGQKLYIHFNQKGVANTMTINGNLISSTQYPPPTIVSGRTMIHVDVIEEMAKASIVRVDEIRLINIRNDLPHSVLEMENMLERLVLCVHESDEHLYKVFKESRIASRHKLEQLLQEYYTYEISQLIIEHYYRKDVNGLYKVIPTERPITIAPINNIESMEIRSLSSGNNELSWVLHTKRKPTAFSSYKVHSQYEFRLQDKQLIIVEIIHHLVDNRGRTNDVYGGGIEL